MGLTVLTLKTDHKLFEPWHTLYKLFSKTNAHANDFCKMSEIKSVVSYRSTGFEVTLINCIFLYLLYNIFYKCHILWVVSLFKITM